MDVLRKAHAHSRALFKKLFLIEREKRRKKKIHNKIKSPNEERKRIELEKSITR